MTDQTPQVDHERVLLDALDTCLQHGNPPAHATNSEWLAGMWLTAPAEARAALLTRLAIDAAPSWKDRSWADFARISDLVMSPAGLLDWVMDLPFGTYDGEALERIIIRQYGKI